MGRVITEYLNLWFRRLQRIRRILQKMTLVQICVGFAAGCISFYLDSVILVVLGSSLLLGKRCWVLILLIAIGAAYSNSWEGSFDSDLGVKAITGRVEYQLHESGFRDSLVVSTEEYGKVYIDIPKQYPRLLPTMEVEILGEIEQLSGQFEGGYYAYLFSQGINRYISSDKYRVITNQETLAGYRSGLISSGNRVLINNLPTTHAGLMSGMLVGDTSMLPREFKQEVQRVGLSHVTAVSGFNISILIIYITIFAGWIHRRVLLGISGICIVGFAFIVGFENLPALRAMMMGLVMLIAVWTGRRSGIWLGLIYVVALLTLMNPRIWMNVSLQLSVSALVGVYLFTPAFQSWIKALPGVIGETIATTLAATISTFPIVVISFGGISIVSLLANLLVVPLIPIIMLFGFVGLVLSAAIPDLSKLLFVPVQVLLDWTVGVVEGLSNLSFAYTSEPWLILAIGFGLGAVLLVYDLSKCRIKFSYQN